MNAPILTKTPKVKRCKKSKKNIKVLGPIQDLEAHVRPDWWRHIFNATYLKTDGDVVDDEEMTTREVDLFLELLHPEPESSFLDLCCGQGRHALELTRREFEVEGLDRSRYLIRKARSIAKKENLNTKFREGDSRKLPYPKDHFDIVTLLGNSFGYFVTEQDDLRVLKEVAKILKPKGRILLDVTDGEYQKKHFQARSWEWIDETLFVCRERTLSGDNRCLISREVVTDVMKGVIADQFYSERLYCWDDLKNLLTLAGFSNPRSHNEIVTNSTRGQDLGMMERRQIITASIHKPWSKKVKKRTNTVRNVVVLLGDPKRPDIIKPDTVFDDDDYHTIDQLKSTLQMMPEYRFHYLATHESLIMDIRKRNGRNDLFLNLCDEGFNNNPFQELHVPALLEILDLPYTGSPPHCLAYCYDKSLVRGIASEMDIPVPKAFCIVPEETTFELQLNFPVIVKPNFGDSSFGITQKSVAHSTVELLELISDIREKWGYDKPILVEEFLCGKDLSMGVIGNLASSYQILPIIEEDYSELPKDLPRICGYEAKWLPDSPYWRIKSIPAELDERTRKTIEDCSMKLFDRLGCRDYSRFDWRLNDQGEPKLLEVNPNPGWCWDGHLAKMAKLANLDYSDMLQAILEAAEIRLGNKAL